MVVGITGGIGSGKSSVSQIFANNGFYVIDCDKISHDIDKLDEYKKQVLKHFGPEVFNNDTIDRKKLAEVAFSSKENKEILESISHPIIINEINRLRKNAIDVGLDCVFDAPLLFESSLDKECNYTIGVLSDKETRINRAIIRGGLEEREIRIRVLMQPDNDYYINRCDFVVYNDGTFEDLNNSVEILIKKIRGERV